MSVKAVKKVLIKSKKLQDLSKLLNDNLCNHRPIDVRQYLALSAEDLLWVLEGVDFRDYSQTIILELMRFDCGVNYRSLRPRFDKWARMGVCPYHSSYRSQFKRVFERFTPNRNTWRVYGYKKPLKVHELFMLIVGSRCLWTPDAGCV